jgi:hypothetical protein
MVDELGFDKVGKVREGFGLFVSFNPVLTRAEKLRFQGRPS